MRDVTHRRRGHCRVTCVAGCDPAAAWPVPVETDDPLPQPGEVRTGWNRRTPLAASGGPARIPPFRSVARWLAPPSDRPIVTAPPV